MVEMIAWGQEKGRESLNDIQNQNKEMRFLQILCYYLSSLQLPEWDKKPLNSVLGETTTIRLPDLHIVAEQVAHHPPTTALWAWDAKNNLLTEGHLEYHPTFHGNSVGVCFEGTSQITFDHQGRREVYVMDPPLPTIVTRGVIMGRKYLTLEGSVIFRCEANNLQATLTFHGHQKFKGEIKNTHTSQKILRLKGSVGEDMTITNLLTGENSHMKLVRSCANDEQNSQEIGIGEGEFASVVIWKSVKRHIRDKNFSAADKSKRQVEQTQRQYITSIGGESNHQPTYFEKIDSDYRFRAPHEDLP
jgi:hypothetical protein